MNYTRKYYESFLDSLFEIVNLKQDDFINLNLQKKKLELLILKSKKFNILNIDIDEKSSDQLKSKAKNNFKKSQSDLAEFLYNNLGKLLYTFERTERSADYAAALEIYRTELPFSVVSKWNILENPSKEFSMDLLFFDMNRRWTSIKIESEFLEYKKELRKNKSSLRYTKKDKRIPKRKLEKLEKHFQAKFDTTISYIEKHYPSIKREFTIYDSNVRMYIIDRNGVPGQTTKQTKTYKDLAPKNKCFIYPYLLNLATRFNNLEEIQSTSLGYSESLFEIDDLEKYDMDFDLRRIHFELLYIFLKNCSKSQKKEFLKYLIKCNLSTRVSESEENDVLTIFHKKQCKLFIDNTPNLNSLKKTLKDGTYSHVAFTNRPDEETINYLKQVNIESIIINQIARHYINIENGDLIHHFIKENLIDLNLESKYQNKSHELISKLKNCPLGMDGWSEFEEICTEIFEYLFGDNFRNYTHKVQAYTNDNIFRRDLIINNNFNDTTSIWGQAKSDFNCNLIVVDFKNYSEPLEQNEFYLPSKYLNLNTGKFGILMTRKGLGNSAKTLQKRMLNLNNELLISLSEDDLVQMIKEKSLNQDPSYRLENIKFSLYETV